MSAEEEKHEDLPVCSHCGEKVTGEYMSGDDGLLLHAECVEPWQASNSPNCGHCNEIIDGEYVEAENIVTKENVNLHEPCLEDWRKATRPDCKRCEKQILHDDYATLEADFYHQDCKEDAEKSRAQEIQAAEDEEEAAAKKKAAEEEEEAAKKKAAEEEAAEAARVAAAAEEEAARVAAEEEAARKVAAEEAEAKQKAEAEATRVAAQEAEAKKAEAEAAEQKKTEEAAAAEEKQAASTKSNPPAGSAKSTPPAQSAKSTPPAQSAKSTPPAQSAKSTPPAEGAKSAAASAAAGEKKAPTTSGAKKAAPKKSFVKKSAPNSAASSVNPPPPATDSAAASTNEDKAALKVREGKAAEEAEAQQKAEAEATRVAAEEAEAKKAAEEAEAKKAAEEAEAKKAEAEAEEQKKKNEEKAAAVAKNTNVLTKTPSTSPMVKPKAGVKVAVKKTPSASQNKSPTNTDSGAFLTHTDMGSPLKKDPEPEAAPKKNLDEFDETLSVPGMETTAELFRSLDYNGNGMLSLAELDKSIVQLWPKFNSKPAIMRAYKAADKNQTGFVSKREFEYFLDYIVLYHNTWVNFAKIDTSGDRRLSEEEFIKGAVQLGIKGESEESLKQMFDDMDKNDGGIVLFDEFCAAFAQKGAILRAPTPEKVPAPSPKKPQQPKSARVVGNTSFGSPAKKEFGTNSSGMKSARPTAVDPYSRPVVETSLSAPKHKPAPPPPTPPQELKMPGPPPKKIRLQDPSVEALEAKVRERRAAERLRQEEMHRKAQMMQEEFDRREQERAEEREKLLEYERRAKEEYYNRQREEREQAEIARQKRLDGVLKVDMDVILGSKSIADKFAERQAELKRQEEEDLIAAREHRKQVCAMGPNFYSELKEHEERLRARAEIEAKERQNYRVKIQAEMVPPLPQEYQTRVRQNILKSDHQKRSDMIHHRTISHEKRAKSLAYAHGAQKEHMPTQTKEFVPPEIKKTSPRESKNTRGQGNDAIRCSPASPSSKNATLKEEKLRAAAQ